MNLLGTSKKIAGIDIAPHHVRFVEMERGISSDRILSYGEVSSEKEIFRGRAILLRDELAELLKEVKKKLTTDEIHISLPAGFEEDDVWDILAMAKIKPTKAVPLAAALVRACVPRGSKTSFMIVNTEPDVCSYVIFEPGQGVGISQSTGDIRSVISNLDQAFIDWYNEHKEKIHHIIFVGSLSRDKDFMNKVSKETRIHTSLGNALVNVRVKTGVIPVITKDDSYKYAVALGLTIS